VKGGRRRDGNHSSKKNSILNSAGNKENRHPVPDSEKQ
jgi:hypothetical protein